MQIFIKCLIRHMGVFILTYLLYLSFTFSFHLYQIFLYYELLKMEFICVFLSVLEYVYSLLSSKQIQS